MSSNELFFFSCHCYTIQFRFCICSEGKYLNPNGVLNWRKLTFNDQLSGEIFMNQWIFFQYALITPSIWNFFPFKYVRKFGERLLKNPGGNSSLGSVGVKNATRAIIQNHFILSFLHIIALLLVIKRQNCELPMFIVWIQEQANNSWMKHQYLVLHAIPSQIMVCRFWEIIFSPSLFRKKNWQWRSHRKIWSFSKLSC